MPSMLRRTLCAFTLASAFAAPFAHAATLVVDDDGVQCVGAGYTTITAALAAANATGDTIQVCDGTYAEGTITVAKEVVIDGVNRDATLVNVTASTTFGFLVQADNVTIRDLVIQEIGGGAVSGAAGIRYESASPLDNEVVDNVVIRDFLDGSARGIEIHDATMNDLSVTNSTFTNNLYGVRMSANSHVDGFSLTDSTFSAPTNAGDFTRIGVYQANDGGTSTFHDFQASGNTFSNFSLAGMFIEELQDSTIEENQFTGSYTGIILNKVWASSGDALQGVVIDDNTFTDNTGRAVFLASTNLGLGSGNIISNNQINENVGLLLAGSGRGAITTNLDTDFVHQPLNISGNEITFTGTFAGATTTWGLQLVGDGPMTISGNSFDGNDIVSSGAPPFAAIYIDSNHSSFGLRQDPLQITCNDIVDFVHGITVYTSAGATWGGLTPGVEIDVHSNNITGNSAFGVYNAGTSATIDATGNWWGDPSGPGGQGPGTGDAISENVDGSAWLTGPVTACTALSITKTADPDPVDPGAQLTYTITVFNNGLADATGVVVTDTLPAELSGVTTSGCDEDPNGGATCTLGTIAGGSSASYTVTGTVSTSAPSSISNTATLSATGIPADDYDDSVTTNTAVNVGADLDLEKVLVSAGPFRQGDLIDFRFDVTNNGPSDATGVTVTDPLPAGLEFVSSPCATAADQLVTWNVGALAVDASASCQITVRATGYGATQNTATVTGTPADQGGADASTVAFDVAYVAIPLAGPTGLAMLAAILALAGAWAVVRIR